jgi:dTDP-4-dehydrorhamnose reductase
MTRIAVTGLSGVIGTLLLPHLPLKNSDVIELYHRQPVLSSAAGTSVKVDLASPRALINQLNNLKIDVFIHLAAVTHIDRCELDRKHGSKSNVWKVNVGATKIISEYCQKHSARMMMLSTECVFDGTTPFYDEHAEPSPKNWYGQTKAAAEKHVSKLGSLGTIIRATIAYHPEDNNQTIYGKIEQLYKQNKPFSVVSDQYVTYTYTPDIIKTILAVYKKKISGVVHVSTNQELTPFEFSQTLAKYVGYDSQLARPVSMVEYLGEQKAKLRLQHASLGNTTSHHKVGFKPRTLLEVLA